MAIAFIVLGFAFSYIDLQWSNKCNALSLTDDITHDEIVACSNSSAYNPFIWTFFALGFIIIPILTRLDKGK